MDGGTREVRARTTIIWLVAILGVSRDWGSAHAGFITALDSSYAVVVSAEKGFAPAVTGGDSQSEGSTINALTANGSALATAAPDESILATAAGSATWTSASQGQVTFTNVGWTTVDASGFVDLSGGTGWTYSFVSNVTGTFVVNYNITASGESSSNPPLFGLNGFFVYGGLAQSSLGTVFDATGLNTSGSFSMAIAPGQSYWVQIQDSANIYGELGTSSAHMNGTFDFNVQAAGDPPQGTPEPTSWVLMLIAVGLAGCAAGVRRRGF